VNLRALRVVTIKTNYNLIKLVRQSQIVQNAMYSHMYDAVSRVSDNSCGAIHFLSARDFDDETYPCSGYV